MKRLYLDIETYSSLNLKKRGVYRYSESESFEILLLAYAFDSETVEVVDLANGEQIPSKVLEAFKDPGVIKCAHNANFERVCLRSAGYDIPIEQWECTAVKASYLGMPRSLKDLSTHCRLKEHSKKDGSALIKSFCAPKKTKKGLKKFTRLDAPDLWEDFKSYVRFDVESLRSIDSKISKYEWPEFEKLNYVLDQKINDKGILIDKTLVNKAIELRDELIQQIEFKTAYLNLRSGKQVKEFIRAEGVNVTSLNKEAVKKLKGEPISQKVRDVLEAREIVNKSSLKKLDTMASVAMKADGRARGLFAAFGARTGRWAGRLIQLQNLPRNSKQGEALLNARNSVLDGTLMNSDTKPHETISDLIRTCLIPNKGNKFIVADFSAIEARVLSWLAGEEWRLEVFRTHGKIYEASAARMFNVPIEEVTKGSDYRQKGKIAELALGYQGGVGALAAMDGGTMDDETRKQIVKQWRAANPKIANTWYEIEDSIYAYSTRCPGIKCLNNFICIDKVQNALRITLPSARAIHYRYFFSIKENMDGVNRIDEGRLMGYHVQNKGTEHTYGGKLIENVVQAIARDVLAVSMQRLDAAGFEIVAHVHDEVICEVPAAEADEKLELMCKIMGTQIDWAPGLPLKADGFTCDFYQKD